MLEHYQRHIPKLANVTPRKKDRLSTIQNDVLHEFTDKATDFDHVLLQLMGTDIENSLCKYRVSYGHVTFMIKTFELLMKSCKKFDLLFVHIPCTTACSLEKVNFKV